MKKFLFRTSGLLVVTFFAITLVNAPTAADPILTASEAPSDPFEAAEEADAPVEIKSARSETTTEYANPDGSVTRDMRAFPIRAMTEDGWKKTDYELEVGADGFVRPKVSSESIALSGGGSDALISTKISSVQLTQAWHEELPTPSLDENKATYANVYPGVDLVLTVSDAGVSHVLVIKDSEAAGNPELRTITMSVDVEGGSLDKKPDGSMNILDRFDRNVAVAPEPAMWDSSGQVVVGTSTQVPDHTDQAIDVRSTGAVEGDEIDRVISTLEDGELTLRPPVEALVGDQVEYPVYVDPVVAPADHSRAMVFKENGNSKFYNWSESNQGVGYQTGFGQGTSTKRLFYRFSTKLKGFDITKATFSVDREHASSCNDTTLRLYRTSTISSSTTWNDQPNWNTLQSSVADKLPSGCNFNSGVDELEWKALQAAQDVAASGNSTITFGIRGSETDRYQWRRLDKNPTFSVTYNRPPRVPTGLALNSRRIACRVDPTKHDKQSTIGPGGAPTFIANFADPEGSDGLTATWQLFNSPTVANATTLKQSLSTNMGTGRTNKMSPAVTALLDGNGKVKGGVYSFRVISSDASSNSGWSPLCAFEVDPFKPLVPEIDPSDAEWAFPGGGHPVTFRPNPEDKTADFTSYTWSVNSDVPQTTQALGTTKVISPVISAKKVGLNILRVWTVDDAGSRSETPAEFEFEALSTFGTGSTYSRYRLNENSGSTAADSGTRHLDLSGTLRWVFLRQYVGADGTIIDDSSLAFDPLDPALGSANVKTAAPVVSSSDSFTVSAWLDPVPAIGAQASAVSQGSAANSTFRLGLAKTGCVDEQNEPMPACYEFGVFNPASGNYVSARSTAMVDLEDPSMQHVIGRYSAEANTVSICVFDDSCTFEEAPGRVDAVDFPAVGSSLKLGSSQQGGAEIARWSGLIDEAFVGQGITDAAVLRQLHDGAEK